MSFDPKSKEKNSIDGSIESNERESFENHENEDDLLIEQLESKQAEVDGLLEEIDQWSVDDTLSDSEESQRAEEEMGQLREETSALKRTFLTKLKEIGDFRIGHLTSDFRDFQSRNIEEHLDIPNSKEVLAFLDKRLEVLYFKHREFLNRNIKSAHKKEGKRSLNWDAELVDELHKITDIYSRSAKGEGEMWERKTRELRDFYRKRITSLLKNGDVDLALEEWKSYPVSTNDLNTYFEGEIVDAYIENGGDLEKLEDDPDLVFLVIDKLIRDAQKYGESDKQFKKLGRLIEKSDLSRRPDIISRLEHFRDLDFIEQVSEQTATEMLEINLENSKVDVILDEMNFFQDAIRNMTDEDRDGFIQTASKHIGSLSSAERQINALGSMMNYLRLSEKEYGGLFNAIDGEHLGSSLENKFAHKFPLALLINSHCFSESDRSDPNEYVGQVFDNNEVEEIIKRRLLEQIKKHPELFEGLDIEKAENEFVSYVIGIIEHNAEDSYSYHGGQSSSVDYVLLIKEQQLLDEEEIDGLVDKFTKGLKCEHQKSPYSQSEYGYSDNLNNLLKILDLPDELLPEEKVEQTLNYFLERHNTHALLIIVDGYYNNSKITIGNFEFNFTHEQIKRATDFVIEQGSDEEVNILLFNLFFEQPRIDNEKVKKILDSIREKNRNIDCDEFLRVYRTGDQIKSLERDNERLSEQDSISEYDKKSLLKQQREVQIASIFSGEVGEEIFERMINNGDANILEAVFDEITNRNNEFTQDLINKGIIKSIEVNNEMLNRKLVKHLEYSGNYNSGLEHRYNQLFDNVISSGDPKGFDALLQVDKYHNYLSENQKKALFSESIRLKHVSCLDTLLDQFSQISKLDEKLIEELIDLVIEVGKPKLLVRLYEIDSKINIGEQQGGLNQEQRKRYIEALIVNGSSYTKIDILVRVNNSDQDSKFNIDINKHRQALIDSVLNEGETSSIRRLYIEDEIALTRTDIQTIFEHVKEQSKFIIADVITDNKALEVKGVGGERMLNKSQLQELVENFAEDLSFNDIKDIEYKSKKKGVNVRGELKDAIDNYEVTDEGELESLIDLGYAGRDYYERYWQSIEGKEANTMDKQIDTARVMHNLIENGHYDIFDQYGLEVSYNGERIEASTFVKEFIERNKIGDKGKTIAVLLSAREYREGSELKDVLESVADYIADYQQTLDKHNIENIPPGLRVSMGMEYEITASTAKGYKRVTGNDLKQDILEISRLANIGTGNDGVHETATHPTDNPLLMILEHNLLQDLNFMDFNFTKDKQLDKKDKDFCRGSHGMHLTLGGEHGIKDNGDVNFLQNMLTVCNWGTINAGESLGRLGYSRSVRERGIRGEMHGSFKVFDEVTNSAELRVMDINTQEMYERTIMASHYAAVACQAVDKHLNYHINGVVSELQISLSEDDEFDEDTLFRVLEERDLISEKIDDERTKKIIFEWINLIMESKKIIEDHNKNAYETETQGYWDEEKQDYIMPTDFGGSKATLRRFEEVAAQQNMSVEEYFNESNVDFNGMFRGTTMDMANVFSRLSNLALKGDATNIYAMINNTKIPDSENPRGQIEESDSGRYERSVFDTSGKMREGYYYVQGASQKFIIHAMQIKMLEFMSSMKDIIGSQSSAVSNRDALAA